jgi:hypothetical protein
MFILGDLRIWGILFGAVVALIAASIAFKAFTGRDLEPPHDDDGAG